MSQNEKTSLPPRQGRGPMGGPGMMPGEKAKDFKGTDRKSVV